MEVLKIFEDKFHQIIKDKVKSVLLEGNDSTDVEESPKKGWIPDKFNSLACSYCQVQFDHVTQQREHYKLDWHRYNLRQSLFQKPPITEQDFTVKTTNDDISSISGSDSDREEDTLDTYATAQGKIFLQNKEGQVFSLYACLVSDKKEDLNDTILSTRIKECCVENRKWAVFMLGGGHFAGAIFDGDNAILHKTFHCYTVRAGQGGAQSSRDSKTGGAHPKSAGASLRRYNEQALVQHVRGIVEGWKNELDRCSLIIYRAAGPYNRSVLFGGSVPLLERADRRVRAIPFSTRRATFAEVKRVHSMLSVVHVYGSLESAIEHFSRQKQPELNSRRNKTKNSCIDRAKSRELVERPLPVEPVSDSSDGSATFDLSTEDQQIALDDSLRAFEDSLTPEQRKEGSKKKKKPKKSKAKKLREQEQQKRNELVDVLCRGHLDRLSQLLEEQLTVENKEVFVNRVLDDKGNTLLHVAAMNEQRETLDFLLKNEANPCLKNQQQQTPYSCTQSREIREALKQYARDNPDKYNYNKAQISTNVLTPEELSEKKRAQRKIKREKEKVKRKEDEVKKREEMEKERFLKLSDREKRALAAERRILSQSGAVISRCFFCAADMTGKVPFEYLGNRFCSVDCLKTHRLQNPTVFPS